MTETDTAAAVFARRPDLTPPEFPIDDTEPLNAQFERVQACVELWEAVRRYEQQQREIDARLDARARRAELEDSRPAEDPQAAAARAERRARQLLADRRSRVTLWARQRGLRHVVQTFTDATGTSAERHVLTAPSGHPDLATPPWQHVSPLLIDGQTIVPTVPGDSLADVERWLGIPSDPAKSGEPHPIPHPATTGAWR